MEAVDLLIWIRNLIYLSLLLVALPWLLLRSLRTGRYRRGLRQKLLGCSPSDLRLATTDLATSTPSSIAGSTPTIWLHGVSVGEVQLLEPLVRQLGEAYPDARCVFSTTTDSGMELAQRILPPSIPKLYFPLDFSWAIRSTLNAIQPQLIVLGELELWPNLLDLTSERDIPVVVVNGRLSERSFRGYRRLSKLTRGMFAKVHFVVAQTTEYAQRFIACGCPPERVHVAGNLKFDNVAFEREDNRTAALRSEASIPDSARLLVVGSTQSPEELAACEAFIALRETYRDLRLIVVPRHPDRFEAVFRILAEQPVRLARRSQLDPHRVDADWEVLLVDTVGELRWWWGLAEIAIVGGSFGSRGGQNMIEPSAFGANVAFGPNTSNFKDVTELLIGADAATRIPSLDAIEPWLRDQLANPEPGRQRGIRAKELVASQQGAGDRTLELLGRCLASESAASRAA